LNNKYEDTKKYNLNRFTINQHFIPKESIKRFCDENNQVLLTNLNSKNKKTVKVTSSDVNFIVKRLWNQHAEKRTMKNIEDNFQKTVDKIVDNPNYIFNSTDNNSISLLLPQ
jgi:glutathione peroxidase-family protein